MNFLELTFYAEYFDAVSSNIFLRYPDIINKCYRHHEPMSPRAHEPMSPLNFLTFSPILTQMLYPFIDSDWLPTTKVRRSDWIDKVLEFDMQRTLRRDILL